MPLSTKEAGGPMGRSDNLVTIPAGSSQASRRGGRMLIPPVVTLAAWRVRQTWRLLLVTGAGIIAAVMLVCAVPLYSDVSMSAGLRSALSTSFQTSDIIVQGSSAQISAQIISQATHSINSEFQQKLGPYLSPLEFSIETPVEQLVVGQTSSSKALAKAPDEIRFISASMDQAAARVKLVAGRLPLTSSDDIEIALTPESANRLHVTVGSLLTTAVAFSEIPVRHVVRTYTLQVVGIIELARAGDPYWHGNDYISLSKGRAPGFIYTALASNENLIAVFNRTANDPDISGTTLDGPFTLFWYYPLNPARIGINNLDDVLAGVNSVQVDIANNPDLNRAPYLTQTTALLPSNILHLFHDRAAVARIPVTSLLVFVLGLVLFFVSMMADFLVDRQSDSISILRSRGASRSQIFGSFTVQSLALGLIALVIGPLLAAAAVFFIVPAADQRSLSLIAGDPWGTALSLAGYALVAAVACVIAMVIAIYRAMQLDVLAMRREAARSTSRPLWQRIYLDIVAVIITLTGFAITFYLTNSGVLDAQLRLLLLSPLTLLGIVFLLIAALLVFLRLFQLLLRLGAWLAARSQGAAPMLALAQMARAPRQSVRMTLLFALAAAFVIFTLVYSASQAQRIPEVAAYQSGADFSGVPENPNLTAIALKDETQAYQGINGVTSATLGYKTTAIGGGNILAISIALMAVDSDNFAQTAIWPPQDSTQSLSSLMAQLTRQRKAAVARNTVPAIVDASTWDALHLSPGATFTLNFFPYGPLTFTALAEVQHIPTITDSSAGNSADDTVPSGGVLVDYQTFAPVYINNFAQFGVDLPINYTWLRTGDDAASLGSVRKALSTGCCMVLNQLNDRRALTASLQNDPLYLDLLGVLGIGATTAMLLALAGNLIASWLSARRRLTNFAVLRALGATPRQIASILTWEQGIIYTTALALGLLFGALFSFLALPVMVFTSVPSSSSDTSSGTFYVVQNVPPITIVIPGTLFIILSALIVICVIALGMMVRVVSKPSISQTLRLNED